MPTPDFVLALREKIGSDLLWMPGVSGVVLDDHNRVLLTQRRDNGQWAVVSGILEPGEQPGLAILREIAEETGVVAVLERLVSVLAEPPKVLPNGDQCQFLDLTFSCRYASGEAGVADDENLDVRWFDLGAMPVMDPNDQARVRRAVEPSAQPYLDT
ncbi:MAG: NUDIX domain-containing protein [Nocardioidaceae bacterium]